MAYRFIILIAALLSTACATLSNAEREQAVQVASSARSTFNNCNQPNACAKRSSLHDLGARALAESTPAAPRHYALILDYGQDALLARVNLFRSATRSIDLQTYIFDEDDAGRLALDELLAAARRGVKVRVLIDQLSALKHVDTLAALVGTHRNFEIRIYNPVLNRARISYPQYVLAAACCWHRLNQRMHSKLLVIDGKVGITGGRNYQDDYYDWSDTYNFRDRDLLLAGPEVKKMRENFEDFWTSRPSMPIERLNDVGAFLLRDGVPQLKMAAFERPARVNEISRAADDAALVQQRLTNAALPVGVVDFLSDPPEKHRRSYEGVAPSMRGLRDLIKSAQDEVLLQTPYLVLSEPAQQIFQQLRRRSNAPDVVISTNSLAATDSFITYALSYKYKRRFLRDYNFQIYEFKPFPEDAPIDIAATGAIDIAWDENGVPIIGPAALEDTRVDTRTTLTSDSKPRPLEREYAALRYAGFSVNERVPLKRAGVRIGLHAKSMVIDQKIGVIGTHNFDPRGDDYNTESAVVIEDPAFASQLASSIRRDMAPENAWVIARRDKPPLFSGLEYSLAKVSEQLPIFDLWPMRYATSYEFRPGPQCPLPLSPKHPDFRTCYEPVGDFPEVNLGFKTLLTRIFTAFGAGLAPIL